MLSLNVYTTISMCMGNDGSSRSSVWTEDVKDPSSNPASSLKFVKRQFFYNTTKQWCFASQMCFMYGSFVGRLKQPSFSKSLLRDETIKGHQSFVTTITLVEFMSSV